MEGDYITASVSWVIYYSLIKISLLYYLYEKKTWLIDFEKHLSCLFKSVLLPYINFSLKHNNFCDKKKISLCTLSFFVQVLLSYGKLTLLSKKKYF